MDTSHEAMPGREAARLRSRTLLLKQVVNAAGTTLTDAGALGSALGIRSMARTMERVLGLWRTRLTAKEGMSLTPARPKPEDPSLGDACGPLLEKAKDFALCTGDKKTVYLNYMRVMCKRGLQNRPSCAWSSRLQAPL